VKDDDANGTTAVEQTQSAVCVGIPIANGPEIWFDIAMPRHALLQKYDALKNQCKTTLYGDENTRILNEIYTECLGFLGSLPRIALVSKVEGKDYFAFQTGGKISRAINKGLYSEELEKWRRLREVLASGDLHGFNAEQITQILYSMAISFCACVDLIKDGDQKTPGTFFEYFVAYFFTWRVGVEPRSSIQILNVDDEDTKLPTDFVFNLGPKKRKFHMPIKTSSRERSIMLWAHQRLLDGVYGVERFMGTPVLLAETKTDKVKKEVVEICLPDQWRVYQLYIAKLKRIYYLDLPTAYAKLNEEFPPIRVRPFGEFFFEWSELSPA
jgi:hypothetical protein